MVLIKEEWLSSSHFISKSCESVILPVAFRRMFHATPKKGNILEHDGTLAVFAAAVR
jgi:hypothetical protein